MPYVAILDEHLGNIATSIREKTQNHNVHYKPREMADAIMALPTLAPMVVSDNQGQYFNYRGAWDSALGPHITTKDLVSCRHMFYQSKVKIIPFDINCKATEITFESMFDGCSQLKEIPKITGKPKPTDLYYLFQGCSSLREIPEDFVDWFDWSTLENSTSAYSNKCGYMFTGCRSLRSLPMSLFEHMNKVSGTTYHYLNNCFNGCSSLDEVVNLPISSSGNVTGNLLSSVVYNCNRLKEFTFAMPDGNPYTMNWKGQYLDLTYCIGYDNRNSGQSILNWNSGITADKLVSDDATYQALKNDPDWYTTNINYSRYNHDSAVNTINSLPDTSAYLASSGGTNTIKFTGVAGGKTDGGAINTLTEEEIAVATAKGWTVSFA